VIIGKWGIVKWCCKKTRLSVAATQFCSKTTVNSFLTVATWEANDRENVFPVHHPTICANVVNFPYKDYAGNTCRSIYRLRMLYMLMKIPSLASYLSQLEPSLNLTRLALLLFPCPAVIHHAVIFWINIHSLNCSRSYSSENYRV